MKKLILIVMLMMPLAGWAQSGPADELIGIFSNYRDAVAAAASEEQYKQLTSEMLGKIGELEEKYPDYEPNDADMERIAIAMKAYTNEEDEVRDRFGILTEEEEAEAQENEAIDAIATYFEDIENLDLRVLTLLKYYTEKIEEVNSQDEFLQITNEMNAVSSRVVPDGYEPSEENQEELEAVAAQMGQTVGKKLKELE